MCEKNGVTEKLEKELLYKPYKCRIIWTCDFLFYLYNAEFVFTSSFHGCAFSAIFKKKFFAINGKKDERINYFLTQNGLSDIAIDSTTDFSSLVGINLFFETLDNNLKKNIEGFLLISRNFLRKQ